MDLREQLQQALGSTHTIEREIVGGGMSRVFVARESSLRREVVIKLLKPELMTHVSLERFKREIEVVATLQHPHIVPLLAAGSVDGIPWYTMPFVKGESLRARLVRGPIPVVETVHILRDIASALAHAHAEGVVHRDIKPENVLLSGGVAVVTDFGVAKAVDVATSHEQLSPGDLTSVGVALGTPAYMSPEQASAERVIDHRADFYSFGCVAYEMLTGRNPFGTRSAREMMAAHAIEKPQPLTRPSGEVPPSLETLITRCLEKRPGDRPQSASELLAALDSVSTPSVSMYAEALRRRSVARVAAVAAVVAVVAVLGFTLLNRDRARAFTLKSTRLVTAQPELELDPAISPDGKLVAYAKGRLGEMRIFVQQIDGAGAVPLSSTLAGDHRWPRWSPDGSRILFVVKDHIGNTVGKAYVVPYVGGEPQRITDQPDERTMTPNWLPDAKAIVYSDGNTLFIRNIEGGVPRRLVSVRHGVHSPAISPDGRTVAYVRGIYAGATLLGITPSSIWTIPVAGGTSVLVTDTTRSNLSPVWSPHGRALLYLSDPTGTRGIYGQNLSSHGAPVGRATAVLPNLGASFWSLSRSGDRAVYAVPSGRSHVWTAPIRPDGVAPVTSLRRVTTEAEAIEGVDVSRDGQWLLYDSNRSGNQDIYKLSLDGGQPIQLTHDPAPDFIPQWSADRREIVYYSMRAGNRDVRVMSADGRDDHAVTNEPSEDYYPSWAPDGKVIAYTSRWGADVRLDAAARTGTHEWSRRVLTSGGSTEIGQFPRWSPDGRWIATTTFEKVLLVPRSGSPVRALIDERKLGGRIRWATWGSDPGVVYVHTLTASGAAQFWTVPLFGAAPRLLLALGREFTMRRQEFATDGRHLYFTLAADESDIWVMELKR